MWRWWFFIQFLKWKGQNKMILQNFGNIALELGVVIWMGGWGSGVVSKLIFALNVILKALVYPIIWSTLHKVPWVGFFACVFMMSFELPSCWKKLFALLCISNIILKIKSSFLKYITHTRSRVVGKESKAIQKEKKLIKKVDFDSRRFNSH